MSLSGRMPSITGPGASGGSTATISGSFTLIGTNGQTYTLPTTTATLARTDAAQSFTGIQTILGTSTLKFGATAAATIGVSADTTAGSLNLIPGSNNGQVLMGLNGKAAAGSWDADKINYGWFGFAGNNSTGNGLLASSSITYVLGASSVRLGSPGSINQAVLSGSSFTLDSATQLILSGTQTAKFGATAAATIGVSADTTSGLLTYTAPSSGTHKFVGGVIVGAYNEQTGATYSVLATDYFINANRAGTITLTLGTATNGRILKVRTITANTVVSASSNVVPAAGGAAGTAILAATAGKWATLMGDGTNWQIIESN